MTMQLSSYQIEFRDTLRRFFEEEFPLKRVREATGKSQSRDPKYWEACLTLGITSGFGGEDPAFGFRELGLMAYETGRGIVSEPLVFHTLCCEYAPRLLNELNVSPKLPVKTAKGDRGTIAYLGDKSIASLVKGKKCALDLVPYGEDATHILVRGSKGGIAEFGLLTLTDAEVVRSNVSSIDSSQPLANLIVTGGNVRVLPPEVSAIMECACSMSVAQTIAGICGRVVELTKEHVCQREQFGVPIGGFQAVQQALASSYTQSEALAALADFAAWAMDSSPSQSELSSFSALSYALEVGSSIVETAIQLHGGMGFTWEHDLHLYLRRVKFWESFYAENEGVDYGVIRAAREAMAR